MIQRGRVLSASQSKTPKLELLGLSFVLLVQVFVCLSVRQTGFLAISDDDYARVVIANEFVRAPSWDPSGTSWLPFPFLLTGSAMTWLGPGLSTARFVAVLSALAGASLLYAAARSLKVSRLWSMAGSILALSLPYAAYLSVATVPEYLTACLLVFAACTSGARLRHRFWGALALFIACASRYEAWPVAGVFALLCLIDASRFHSTRQRAFALLSGALALAFPLLWLTYGVLHHNNALFFVSRVVDYKNALGEPSSPAVEIGLEILRALLFAEPVATCLAGGGLLLLAFARRDLKSTNLLPRAWLVLGAMVLTLIGGAIRGGAPTHHSERALLSCWLLAALSSAVYVAQLPPERKRRTVSVMLAALGAGLLIQANEVFERQDFAARDGEERIGRWLKSNPIRSKAEQSSSIALLTPDYGYFAIMAAHGTPGDFKVIKSHDPRTSEAPGQQALLSWLLDGGCRVVASKSRAIPRASQVFSSEALAVWQNQECGKLAPRP